MILDSGRLDFSGANLKNRAPKRRMLQLFGMIWSPGWHSAISWVIVRGQQLQFREC